MYLIQESVVIAFINFSFALFWIKLQNAEYNNISKICIYD